MDEHQIYGVAISSPLHSFHKQALDCPFDDNVWGEDKENGKWGSHYKASPVSSSSTHQTAAPPFTAFLASSSPNGDFNFLTRRVSVKDEHRFSSRPLHALEVSKTATVSQDETEGSETPPTTETVTGAASRCPSPGSQKVDSTSGDRDENSTILSASPGPADKRRGSLRLSSRIPTPVKSFDGDMCLPLTQEEGRQRLLSSYTKRRSEQSTAVPRFYAGLLKDDNAEKARIPSPGIQQDAGRNADDRFSLPKPSIPISSLRRGAGVCDRDLKTRSFYSEIVSFNHDDVAENAAQGKPLMSLLPSQSLSRLNAKVSYYKHLSLSPEVIRKFLTRRFSNSHTSHPLKAESGMAGACPTNPKTTTFRKAQARPLAASNKRPRPLSYPRVLQAQASPSVGSQPTSTHYSSSGPAAKVLRKNSETSKKEQPGVLNTTSVEKRRRPISFPNSFTMQKAKHPEQPSLASPASKMRERYAEGQRDESGRMVSEAQPRQYWLGRLVTLSNAFHYEDSFNAPDVATGFGMRSKFSGPRSYSAMDSSKYRIKRAFMVLERACLTDEAKQSFRVFRDEYVSQYGYRWMF